MITPVELEELIYCYATVEAPSLAPARVSARSRFIRMGVACHRNDVESENPFMLTPLGKAWLKTILSTPVPTVAFVDAQGKVIE